MKEDLLHYAWRLKKIDYSQLYTEDNAKIEIINPGVHNSNAGPDFLQAKIKIHDTIWAGHIEMHLNSSDWHKHKHSADPAYDNVILHVVYNHDMDIYRSDGTRIPTVSLQTLISPDLINRYQELMRNESWVYCSDKIESVSEFIKTSWLNRLIVDRLEKKTKVIRSDLERFDMDWERVFFIHLAIHLGAKVNNDGFRFLTESLPLNYLNKYRGSLIEIEALLFGQAGLLDRDFKDEYPKKLKTIFTHQKNKFQTSPINKAVWNFLRLRPPNFPTIRIAQLATLINQTQHIFSKCMAANNVKELINVFEIKVSNYWKNHYVFDKVSQKVIDKKLGQTTIYNLIINCISPFLFVYGREKGVIKYEEKAIRFLEELKPEKNSIIRKWHSLGYEAYSASDTQALIQLKNEYCNYERCLQCHIGNRIISQ